MGFFRHKKYGGGLFMMLAYKLITSKEMKKMENFSSLTSPGRIVKVEVSGAQHSVPQY